MVTLSRRASGFGGKSLQDRGNRLIRPGQYLAIDRHADQRGNHRFRGRLDVGGTHKAGAVIGTAGHLLAVNTDDDGFQARKPIRLVEEWTEAGAVAGCLPVGKAGERQGCDKAECGSSFHGAEVRHRGALEKGK